MIDLLRCFRRTGHPIRLNEEFQSYLQWHHQFLLQWHGVTFWLFPSLSPTVDPEVTSDTAGAEGLWGILPDSVVQWLMGQRTNPALARLQAAVSSGYCGAC